MLFALGHVRVAHAASFRVVVRITSEMSRALAERIRGQTSDLALELVTVDTGPLEPTLGSQLDSATAVARLYQADAVVWFDDLGAPSMRSNHLIAVLQPKAHRLLVRELTDPIATSKRPPSASAELEAGALIVRAAMQAMMGGGVIGVEQATIVPPEPPKPPPVAAPPPVIPKFEAGDAASALPGVIRVPVAGPVERLGVAAAGLGGYGFTESVLGVGETNQRLFASAAASVRPIDWLAFAVRFDGRYDWHRGVPQGDSSGWVGEPHLGARVGPSLPGELRAGAELDVGFPGDHVPSIDLAATSPALSLLATYAPEAAPLAVASLVGFRLDRGAQAIANLDGLSRSQRLSIGASDTNALLFGLGATGSVAPHWEVLGEWTWDLRAPSKGARAGQSPMRIDAGARFTPSESGTVQLQLIFEASPSARPAIAPGEPLVIVEPRLSFALGVNLRPPRPLAHLEPPR